MRRKLPWSVILHLFFLFKSKPRISDISVSSIAPNLKMLGSGKKLIMVLSRPIFDELPEIILQFFHLV